MRPLSRRRLLGLVSLSPVALTARVVAGQDCSGSFPDYRGSARSLGSSRAWATSSWPRSRRCGRCLRLRSRARCHTLDAVDAIAPLAKEAPTVSKVFQISRVTL